MTEECQPAVELESLDSILQNRSSLNLSELPEMCNDDDQNASDVDNDLDIKIINTFSLANAESHRKEKKRKVFKSSLCTDYDPIINKAMKFDQIDDFTFTSFKSRDIANCFDKSYDEYIDVGESDEDNRWLDLRLMVSYKCQATDGFRPRLEPDLQDIRRKQGYRGICQKLKPFDRILSNNLLEEKLVSDNEDEEVSKTYEDEPKETVDARFEIAAEPAQPKYKSTDVVAKSLHQPDNVCLESMHKQWKHTAKKDLLPSPHHHRNEDSSNIFLSKELDELLQQESGKTQKQLFKVETVKPSIADLRFQTPTTQSSYIKTLESALGKKNPIDTKVNCWITPQTYWEAVNEMRLKALGQKSVGNLSDKKDKNDQSYAEKSKMGHSHASENASNNPLSKLMPETPIFVKVLSKTQAQFALKTFTKNIPSTSSTMHLSKSKNIKWRKRPLIYKSKSILCSDKLPDVVNLSKSCSILNKRKLSEPTSNIESKFRKVQTQGKFNLTNIRKALLHRHGLGSRNKKQERKLSLGDPNAGGLILSKEDNPCDDTTDELNFTKNPQKILKTSIAETARKLLKRSKESRQETESPMEDTEVELEQTNKDCDADKTLDHGAVSRQEFSVLNGGSKEACGETSFQMLECRGPKADGTINVEKACKCADDNHCTCHPSKEILPKGPLVLDGSIMRDIWKLFTIIHFPSTEVTGGCSTTWIGTTRIFKIISHCKNWVKQKVAVVRAILGMDLNLEKQDAWYIATDVGDYFVEILSRAKATEDCNLILPEDILDIAKKLDTNNRLTMTLVQIYKKEVRNNVLGKDLKYCVHKGWRQMHELDCMQLSSRHLPMEYQPDVLGFIDAQLESVDEKKYFLKLLNIGNLVNIPIDVAQLSDLGQKIVTNSHENMIGNTKTVELPSRSESSCTLNSSSGLKTVNNESPLLRKLLETRDVMQTNNVSNRLAGTLTNIHLDHSYAMPFCKNERMSELFKSSTFCISDCLRKIVALQQKTTHETLSSMARIGGSIYGIEEIAANGIGAVEEVDSEMHKNMPPCSFSNVDSCSEGLLPVSVASYSKVCSSSSTKQSQSLPSCVLMKQSYAKVTGSCSLEIQVCPTQKSLPPVMYHDAPVVKNVPSEQITLSVSGKNIINSTSITFRANERFSEPDLFRKSPEKTAAKQLKQMIGSCSQEIDDCEKTLCTNSAPLPIISEQMILVPVSLSSIYPRTFIESKNSTTFDPLLPDSSKSPILSSPSSLMVCFGTSTKSSISQPSSCHSPLTKVQDSLLLVSKVEGNISTKKESFIGDPKTELCETALVPIMGVTEKCMKLPKITPLIACDAVSSSDVIVPVISQTLTATSSSIKFTQKQSSGINDNNCTVTWSSQIVNKETPKYPLGKVIAEVSVTKPPCSTTPCVTSIIGPLSTTKSGTANQAIKDVGLNYLSPAQTSSTNTKQIHTLTVVEQKTAISTSQLRDITSVSNINCPILLLPILSSSCAATTTDCYSVSSFSRVNETYAASSSSASQSETGLHRKDLSPDTSTSKVCITCVSNINRPIPLLPILNNSCDATTTVCKSVSNFSGVAETHAASSSSASPLEKGLHRKDSSPDISTSKVCITCVSNINRPIPPLPILSNSCDATTTVCKSVSSFSGAHRTHAPSSSSLSQTGTGLHQKEDSSPSGISTSKVCPSPSSIISAFSLENNTNLCDSQKKAQIDNQKRIRFPDFDQQKSAEATIGYKPAKLKSSSSSKIQLRAYSFQRKISICPQSSSHLAGGLQSADPLSASCAMVNQPVETFTSPKYTNVTSCSPTSNCVKYMNLHTDLKSPVSTSQEPTPLSTCGDLSNILNSNTVAVEQPDPSSDLFANPSSFTQTTSTIKKSHTFHVLKTSSQCPNGMRLRQLVKNNLSRFTFEFLVVPEVKCWTGMLDRRKGKRRLRVKMTTATALNLISKFKSERKPRLKLLNNTGLSVGTLHTVLTRAFGRFSKNEQNILSLSARLKRSDVKLFNGCVEKSSKIPDMLGFTAMRIFNGLVKNIGTNVESSTSVSNTSNDIVLNESPIPEHTTDIEMPKKTMHFAKNLTKPVDTNLSVDNSLVTVNVPDDVLTQLMDLVGQSKVETPALSKSSCRDGEDSRNIFDDILASMGSDKELQTSCGAPVAKSATLLEVSPFVPCETGDNGNIVKSGGAGVISNAVSRPAKISHSAPVCSGSLWPFGPAENSPPNGLSPQELSSNVFEYGDNEQDENGLHNFRGRRQADEQIKAEKLLHE